MELGKVQEVVVRFISINKMPLCVVILHVLENGQQMAPGKELTLPNTRNNVLLTVFL